MSNQHVSLCSSLDVGLRCSLFLLLFLRRRQQIFSAVLLSAELNLQLLFNKETQGSQQSGREEAEEEG